MQSCLRCHGRRPSAAFTLTSLVLLSGVLFALPSQSEEAGSRSAPMFGGTPSRNMVNLVEKNIPGEWSVAEGDQKNVKWAVELGSVAYGGPVIANGKVLIATNNEKPRNPAVKGDKGIIMCFRESDGAFLWQAVHDKLPDPMANDWPLQGIASTPALDGNRAYYLSNRCELVCVDLDGNPDKKEAKTVWTLDLMGKLGVYPRQLAASSPLVIGDLVYAVTGNGVNEDHEIPAPEAPSFVAVDKKTGELRWKDSSPGKKIMDGQWTNPTYAEVNGKGQVIYGGGDGWLYAFEATTGKPVWKFDANPKKAVFKIGGGGDRNYFLATPVVHDNKLFVGVGRNPEDGANVGYFWCLDLSKTGDISPPGDDFDPKAAANKNSGIVWYYGGPIVPKPRLGRSYHFGRTMSTCAIYDGLLYIAELDGFLHCLDAKTGQPQWVYDLKSSVWGSPYYVDGKVFLGNDDGTMLVFPHGRMKPAEKAVTKIEMDRPIKSTAVAVNGTLYVMTDTHLYAIAKK